MSDNIRFAEGIIETLRSEGVRYVFGHPGEQILTLYEALRKSEIEHVLMRHEQGAIHAADAYARISETFGVCIASAGPGALNLTMGIATAYKDSVPILAITGDVPRNLRGCDVFQEIDTASVFEPITLRSWQINNPEEGILKLKEALEIFKKDKTGPINLTIPSDVLNQELENSLIKEEIKIPKQTLDQDEIQRAIELIQKSERPLIIAGAGILWSKATDKLYKFASQYNIPVSTTYHARGVFTDDNDLYLGMIGTRGTERAKYAGKNADVIIALGTRLSERTISGIAECSMIQVNFDERSFKGDINIKQDVGGFLDSMNNLKTADFGDWILKLREYSTHHDINTDLMSMPIKPQKAIKEILDAAEDSIVVNDAGSHTTWVTLLQQIKKPHTSIFSGGFGPMGYALPAAVGASLAKPDRSVLVIVGDGGFQMTIQELATVVQLDLPVTICLINNNALGVIKQWQNMYYQETYEVELENPNFTKLAQAYGIDSLRLDSPGTVYPAVKRALKLKRPYLIEIIVDREETIPLPQNIG